jgi:hypothetical protein
MKIWICKWNAIRSNKKIRIFQIRGSWGNQHDLNRPLAKL